MFNTINKFIGKYSYNDNIKKVFLEYDAVVNIKLNNNKNFFAVTNLEEFNSIEVNTKDFENTLKTLVENHRCK